MLSNVSAPAMACVCRGSRRHRFSAPCEDRKRRASCRVVQRKRICFSKSCTNAVFRDALVRFTVRANVSHRVVELDEFAKLCRALNPQCAQLLLKSHTSIPRQIHSNYERQRSVVAQALQSSASRINICTDSWTSGVNHQG